MKMKGPNPKLFIVLTILTVLAGSGLSYMQYSSYTVLKGKVEDLKKNAKDRTQIQAELTDANAQLNETRGKLVHLEQSIPEPTYVPTMLKELEKLGKESGIDVLGVRPVPKAVVKPMKQEGDGADTTSAKKRKPYTELTIEVRGRGDYKAVMSFIKGLTTFPKIVAARTVSLQPKSDTKNLGAPKLDCTIELRSYLFPADGSTKKADESDAPAADKSINLSGHTKMEVN
jgi:Tfp pilus assembly protein PilO